MAKLTKDYNFAALYPDIAKEWHPTKNGKLTASDVMPSSNKKAWWICKKGHEWQVSPNARGGCPYCYGNRVGYGNDLVSRNPELIKEWHPTKNDDLVPSEIYYRSTKRVWWLCIGGHEWKTAIRKRSSYRRTGCPFCSIQTSRPELYFYCELKSIFNDVIHRHKISHIEVDIFIRDLNLCIEYDGSRYHKNKKEKDKEKKSNLTERGFIVYNIREEPLKKIFPVDIIINPYADFHKNFIEFLHHLLKQNILNRKQKINVKNYLKVGKPRNENLFFDLLSLLPGPLPGLSIKDKLSDIAKEWHPTKNGKLTPSNVSAFSNRKAWWICYNKHSFYASPNKRSNGSNCPYCSGQKVGHGNDLASRNPKLAKEWHPTKNGKLTASDVMPGSGKKRWWLCNKGHDWEAVVSSRNNGSNCPYCSGQKVGHGNDLLSKNPEIAKYWHPTKNGTLKPSDVTPGSNKKVWWLCDNKHESYTTVSNKAGANKRKCKFCYFESRNQRFSNP